MNQIIELVEEQRESPNFKDANLGFMAHHVKEFGEGIIMLLMPKLGALYAREETFFDYAKYITYITGQALNIHYFPLQSYKPKT